MKNVFIGKALAVAVAGSLLALSGCNGGGGGDDEDVVTPPEPTPAIEKFFPVIKEAAPGLDGYTIYRPAKLADVGGKVPVLVWLNGACKKSNHQYWDVLGNIAARGFVVVAFGSNSQVVITESNTVTPVRAWDALNWITNKAGSNSGYELINVDKVGTFGTSCGGLEALLGGADPRVKSVAALNTGFFDAGTTSSISMGGYSPANIKNLHSPLLFIGGGPYDVAYKQTHSNYDVSTVPTVLAENYQGGHSGLWAGIRYTYTDATNTIPSTATVDYTITTESINAVVRWFDYTLNDVKSQKSYFLGSDCGLCKVSGWTVQSKNF